MATVWCCCSALIYGTLISLNTVCDYDYYWLRKHRHTQLMCVSVCVSAELCGYFSFSRSSDSVNCFPWAVGELKGQRMCVCLWEREREREREVAGIFFLYRSLFHQLIMHLCIWHQNAERKTTRCKWPSLVHVLLYVCVSFSGLERKIRLHWLRVAFESCWVELLTATWTMQCALYWCKYHCNGYTLL